MGGDTRHTYQVVATIAPGGAARVEMAAAVLGFDGAADSQPDLPGPADLLAAALAACLSKNLERFSKILGFRYRAGRVSVQLERRDAPPRIIRATYLVEVDSEERAERLELLHRNLRKYGTITNTLAAACDLSGQLVRARLGPG